MPAKACGKRNVSLRCQCLIDSLAPGKSRTGNHQLPPQIHLREEKKMLVQGSSSSVSGKPEACTYRWGRRRHASGFNPGSVTFVGKREPGISQIFDFPASEGMTEKFIVPSFSARRVRRQPLSFRVLRRKILRASGLSMMGNGVFKNDRAKEIA